MIDFTRILVHMDFLEKQATGGARWDRLRYWPESQDSRRRTTVGATDDTTKSCPDNRHEYYTMFLSYQFCPYCGKRIFS